jgi:hypothetical protein
MGWYGQSCKCWCLRASHKLFSQASRRETSYLGYSFCTWWYSQCNQQANRPTKSQTYPFQITVEAKKWFVLLLMHSLHLHKMFTFMCWSSFFGKSDRETWILNPRFLCTHLRDFWGECASLALISSFFSSLSTQEFWFGSFLSNNNAVCLNLLNIVWITASIWNCNRNLCSIFSLLFIHNQHCLVQCATLTWHFSTGYNMTESWLVTAQVKNKVAVVTVDFWMGWHIMLASC